MITNNQSLLFIPDITGFTRFVNQTEVAHSQHIISELLELIVDSNQIGMAVSEIEGDAVLFYKHNEVPLLKDILEQVRKTFLDFHNHLRSYESKRICPCGACTAAINLSLKFIVHRGEIGFTTVKNRKKPFGSDLILVHRLLKNNVGDREYLLLSESFSKDNIESSLIDEKQWSALKTGATIYENIGEVNYNYLNLSNLHQWVKLPTPPPLPKKEKKPVSHEIFILSPLQDVFEKITNFDYRLEWNKGIKELKYEPNRLNRLGTTHRCVIGDNQVIDFETTKNDFGKDKMVYGEKIASLPLIKEAVIYYILTAKSGGTVVKSEIHFNPQPIIGWLMVLLLKSKFKSNTKRALEAIKEACETTELSSEPVLAI